MAVETGKKSSNNYIRIEICDSFGRCCKIKKKYIRLSPNVLEEGQTTLIWGEKMLGPCHHFPTAGSLYLNITTTTIKDQWFGNHVDVAFTSKDTVRCPIQQYMDIRVREGMGKSQLRTNCHKKMKVILRGNKASNLSKHFTFK